MQNVNWRIKAVYLLIAAVLAIGGVVGVLAAKPSASAKSSVTYSATLTATPVYAGVNEAVTFTFTCNMPNATYSIHGDVGTIQSGSVGPGSFVMTWDTPGRKHVAVEALGVTDLWGHTDVRVAGYMLDPGLAHNILGQPETFSLPAGLDPGTNSYVTWSVGGSALPYIQTPWIGGGINDDSITVNCIDIAWTLEGVEAVITAHVQTMDVAGALGPVIDYQGVKMWGKIDATVLMPMVLQVGDGYNGGGVQDSQMGSVGSEWVPATTRSSAVIWSENDKAWEGGISVIETVLGSYNTNPSEENGYTGILEIPADGAVVHWFVVDSTADVSRLASLTSLGAIEAAIDAMPEATQVELQGGTGSAHHQTTVSGVNASGLEGVTGIGVSANGEEAVYIIAVATYPDATITLAVHAEIETWNFYTNEVDVVPQVRWVGEKIVLEKYFGESYNYDLVHFEISKGQGALEDTDLAYTYPDYLSNYMDTDSSVWTIVEDGIARVILQGPNPQEVQVLCSLYDYSGGELGNIVNEHLFVVYFLKLEDITLGNVEGERVDNPLTAAVEGHNSGIFDPANPWADPWGTDEETYLANGGIVGPVDQTTGELNISQDTLLRARVRGWFMGNQDSGREARKIDSNHDGRIDFRDITLPAGRWVLPDDWQYLASIDLEGYNPYWDIMDQPNDNVMSDADGNPNPELSLDDLGAYVEWGHSDLQNPGVDTIDGLVKMWPVVGPYSSLDTYDPYGGIPFENSIVPNGYLNWWDCPMPAAKVTFQVANGLGYFKQVEKGDVYYQLVNTVVGNPNPDAIAYTDPYYALCIPANPWLQDMAFVNNGGYDWNTWDNDYGWYNLWNFVNQQGSDINYPTMVQVYSDNHGEAMVWLNGDNGVNLNGQASWSTLVDKEWTPWTTADWIHGNATVTTTGWQHWTTIVSGGDKVMVGNTTAVASAKYPYFRSDPALYSNTVTKDWTWGEEKLVDVLQLDAVQGGIQFGHKLVLVWLKDRDGMAASGLTVTWQLMGTSASLLSSAEFPVTLSTDNYQAVSVSRLPTTGPTGETATLWNTTKLGPCGSALAGIEVLGTAPSPQISLLISIYTAEGTLIHTELINFAAQDMLDPLLTKGLNTGVYEGKAQSIVDATLTIGPQGSNTLVAIWWLDDSGVWHCYQPGAPAWANDLSNLEPGNTYWVNVSANCMWNWALN